MDEIESRDKLTIYVQHLEKKGFSVQNLQEDAPVLHKYLNEGINEREAITTNLSDLQKFCDDKTNGMPDYIFKDFAREMDFDAEPEVRIKT